MEICSLCKNECTHLQPAKNAPHFTLCGACMEQLCHLDSLRYDWYRAAVRGALFPPERAQLPLSLPPVSFPAILEPESCLFNISES